MRRADSTLSALFAMTRLGIEPQSLAELAVLDDFESPMGIDITRSNHTTVIPQPPYFAYVK